MSIKNKSAHSAKSSKGSLEYFVAVRKAMSFKETKEIFSLLCTSNLLKKERLENFIIALIALSNYLFKIEK